MSRLLTKMEVDRRLVGLAVVLLIIWVGFDIASGGRFITPRNIFNLSVQTASVAVMACGMVLIIVTRHIDLSVGAILGVLAMIMGVVQTDVLPQFLDYNHPLTWILTLLVGIILGVVIAEQHIHALPVLARRHQRLKRRAIGQDFRRHALTVGQRQRFDGRAVDRSGRRAARFGGKRCSACEAEGERI